MDLEKGSVVILLCLTLTSLSSGLGLDATTSTRWYPKTLPCNVSVASNGSVVMVDCTERRLSSIPSGIPGNATNLTLTINFIPELNGTSFHGLENLTEIDMRCNCMPIKIGPKDHICSNRLAIMDNAFSDLKKLRALYLDGNRLVGIPRGLPPNLILLSLEVNNIYYISKENLTEIRNVEIIYLGQNCYYRNPCNVSYEIEHGAFLQLSNLTLLSVKSNNLSYIPPLLPSSLKELYLYNNNIEEVTEEDFKNLTHLEILDISGNCPRCYNSPFPCDPCPNNTQLKLHKNAFQTLTKLRILRMHSNSLTDVLPEWFANLKELKVLDLSSNYLAGAVTHFELPEVLSNLHELDLSFNYELQKYPDTLDLNPSFSVLSSLKVLRLRGFVFQQLTLQGIKPLMDLDNLEVLDLGTNFIKMANLSVLMQLKGFKIINLSDNKISSPSEGQQLFASASGHQDMHWSPMSSAVRFEEEGVREIHYFRYDEYARSCKYKNKELGIVNSFVNTQCSDFGKTLDVSRNNIFFLHSKFLNLSELKCINLSGNAMSQSLDGSEFTYLTNLQYLDFSANRLDLLHSTAFQKLQNLVILDISYNNHYFESEGLTHMLNFTSHLPKLKILLMNHNKISTSTNTEMTSHSLERLEFIDNRLDLLWRDGDGRYIQYFKNLCNLRILDISENNLNFIPRDVLYNMPEKLSELYIRTNKLKMFFWGDIYTLTSLQILDLSGNSLTHVPRVLSNCTKSIQKLILNRNQIAQLSPDFLKDAFTFKYLDLSFNQLKYIEQSSLPDNIVDNMDLLLLHNNLFTCTCNATWFVAWLNRTNVTIPLLATDVTCNSPGAQQGHLVLTVDMLACQHNDLSILLCILLTSTLLAFITLAISSHLFLWDVWYMYHFCVAKLKGYSRGSSTQNCPYDAFVVYEKKDPAVSEWVMNELCVQLEDHGDRPLRLCLEERDWMPGCPLVDNLCQSIHQSKRTRLMDEKNDVIVLIFLEKTACYSKYLRLRKRLYRRSVMEWPTNPQAQPYFWFGLRSVLATESNKHYRSVFKNLPRLKYIGLSDNRLYPIEVGQSPSREENIKSNLISPSHLMAHSLYSSPLPENSECKMAGPVLNLDSNNLFFITPEEFQFYDNISCLNISRNGFSAALNGTEFSSLPNLKYLDLSYNKIDLAYGNAFRELQRLEVLDISYNDHYFKAYGVTLNLAFVKNLPVLRVLNMSNNAIDTLTTKEIESQSLIELQFGKNKLGHLWKDELYFKLFTGFTNLKILDISSNHIDGQIPDKVYDLLPHTLTSLLIGQNKISTFNWTKLEQFNHLVKLDLSENVLTVVESVTSRTLRILNLGSNHIATLSDGFLEDAKRLNTLYLNHNRLTLINQTSFLTKTKNYLETLSLQENPLQCSCDALDFILWFEKNNVTIPKLKTNVKCFTSVNSKPQMLIFFDFKQCDNDTLAFLIFILTSTFIIVTTSLATVAHIFYWDASYVLHYLKAKWKGYRSSASLGNVYDVFVTYDTTDPWVSEWVLDTLRGKLEDEGEKALPLCLEERDWPLGRPLIDNLTQSIRYSRKTLFVLTEAYAKTGVFRLAMYLAHQRLLDENLDVIVVLLLEPVLQHSHFLRLRRRLCGESVVEWPRTAAAEPWFWQNLRNVVRVDNQMMYTKTYSQYFNGSQERA
ncbi:hypothetical protein CRUP_028125 [Coryphaenoides rupestris]|nr:hypothetical protein CRUP_028125 [Coryphaenoides rupestris]